ncbi:MAG: hypothetical protein FJX95_03125 [Bacteroidetes bacterium]|nr:hypothetical protein [Bacteroidota bacterium]
MVEKFPRFFKTLAGTNFYHVQSALSVVEYQRIGLQWLRQDWSAGALPERWYLHDLMENTHGNIVEISVDEFFASVSVANKN